MSSTQLPIRLRVPEIAVAAALTLLLLGITAWARPLMLPDEGRYAGVAWEMLRSGNWSTPMLGGLPFFHKPPLFYWIGAAAMSVFGVNAWAARVPSMLGAWVAIMGLFSFAYCWRGKRLAWSVALVLLAQPLFFGGAQFANLDMLVAGCITATVLLAAHATLCAEAGHPGRWALVGAYACAALGVLAKGLIGAALPGLVIVGWFVATGRWRKLGRLWSAAGLALFLLIAVPWFVRMQTRFPDFLHYFFTVQHFQRFAGSGFNNVQAWWFYPAVLLLAHVLWAPWLVRLLTPGALAGARRDPIRLLMWVWLLVVVVFFSFPRSKLVGYVLPAVPPLVYLLCDSFARQTAPSWLQRRWWFAAPVLAMGLTLALVGWLAAEPLKSSRGMAMALRSARAADEPVFMLGNYYYDVPFYAGLRQPVAVVDAWGDPQIALHDNWRKEMADAARFAPSPASSILVLPAQLPALLCAQPVSWVLGSAEKADTLPLLVGTRVIYQGKSGTLWRMDRAEAERAGRLDCAGMSHAG